MATESNSTSGAKEKAYIALMDAITDAVAEIREESSTHGLAVESGRLRDLAVAFRLTAGGAQPGSSVIDR